MHSYGGVVGSNALERLSWQERNEKGQKGGVVAIVYLAAFLLPLGTSDTIFLLSCVSLATPFPSLCASSRPQYFDPRPH